MASKIITEKPLWRGKKSPKIVRDENDDCGSLAWLLNFRLDEIVNVKVPDDDSLEGYIIPEELPAQRKPPYTYPELIERALREKGELTVSAIYQWISDRFPYYKANDERWKNSVRHNLSINPHFRKGARAPQGAGHLWSLAANAIDLLPRRSPVPEEEKKRPYEEAHILDFPKGVRIATMARGGGRMWSVYGPKLENSPVEQPTRKKHYEEANILDFPKVIVLDEAAIAAASILPDQEVFSGSTMFLNPISSEQVVRECGLLVVD